jgi:hypothetical protein
LGGFTQNNPLMTIKILPGIKNLFDVALKTLINHYPRKNK